MPTMLLAAVLTIIFAWNWRETRRYREFRACEDSARRLAFYWSWTWTSFVILGLGSIGILAAIGRMDALFAIPSEFARLAPRDPNVPIENMSGDTLAGFFIGAALSLGVVAFVWHRRLRKMTHPVVGDIEPLLPRNGHETLMAIPVSLNAGLSEELFFRLALPLLIAAVTGSALVGLVAATIAFGLMHWYQGWKGVLVTSQVGALFAWIYVVSGSLPKVIILHALVDIMALIVRPAVSRLMLRRTANSSLVA
ncbi:CPBP family intramembrane glutamic endopeptidase [Croceibacterium aestuarii]|uniref:CPBP family intramembrane glutamic endopeptidase n=1 Tax=Croceibacterium aestuarii TaxID=3064139 RepID=UPI00272E8B18|nr:CPBP family intramembrane glutamic endopeptidase [Croceibacterium sp. D39]